MSSKEMRELSVEPQVETRLDQKLVEDVSKSDDKLGTFDVTQKSKEAHEDSEFAAEAKDLMFLELRKKGTSIPVELPQHMETSATVSRLKKISLSEVETSQVSA